MDGDAGSAGNGQDDEQLSPLHAAVEADDLSRVQALVIAGANMEEMHHVGENSTHGVVYRGTPLYRAALKGFATVARYLVESGADKEALAKAAAGYYTTALHAAAEEGHIDVVRMLIEHGAIKDSGDDCGLTPLMYACLRGHVALTEYLLEQGCDMEHVDNARRTSLHICATFGDYVDIAQLLIRWGAKKDVPDNSGQTPFEGAISLGRTVVAEFLLEQGCDVDRTDRDGNTPLHLAALRNHLEAAHLLFRWGAKLDVRNNDGETAADVATREGHDHIADAIRAEEIRRRDHGFKRDRSTIEGTVEHEAAKRPRAEREAEEAAAAAAAAAPDESDDDDEDDDDEDEG